MTSFFLTGFLLYYFFFIVSRELEFLKEFEIMKNMFSDVLDAADAEKQIILSGKGKCELSNTWHKEIENRVKQLLSQQLVKTKFIKNFSNLRL